MARESQGSSRTYPGTLNREFLGIHNSYIGLRCSGGAPRSQFAT